MKLTDIHHIAIITSDYERTKHFYVDLLGFEIIRENYRTNKQDTKLDLRLGNAELEIFCVQNPPKRVTDPEACGLRHLAFAVENISHERSEYIAQNIPAFHGREGNSLSAILLFCSFCKDRRPWHFTENVLSETPRKAFLTQLFVLYIQPFGLI